MDWVLPNYRDEEKKRIEPERGLSLYTNERVLSLVTCERSELGIELDFVS